jgi:hypothetical protein
MPRITPVHWTVLEKVFLAAGFWFARQEGSHRSYIKPGISSYDSDRLQKSQIFLQKEKKAHIFVQSLQAFSWSRRKLFASRYPHNNREEVLRLATKQLGLYCARLWLCRSGKSQGGACSIMPPVSSNWKNSSVVRWILRLSGV